MLTALSVVPDAILPAGAATKAVLVLTHLVAAASSSPSSPPAFPTKGAADIRRPVRSQRRGSQDGSRPETPRMRSRSGAWSATSTGGPKRPSIPLDAKCWTMP